MNDAALPGDDHEPQIHKSSEERLVYMANQISDFFASQGKEEAAVSGTADHIRSFWDPLMRKRIYRHIDQAGAAGLKPIALKALEHLREVTPGQLHAELAENHQRSGREPGDDAG